MTSAPVEEMMDGTGADGAPLRVLVVDDDDVDRLAVRRRFAQTGLAVEIGDAAGVLEAIDKLAGGHYDCVLLDYNLPDGDGLTFLRGLRTAGMSVPVIMLTGQNDPSMVEHLTLAGAADYVPKSSLSPQRLLQALSTCCGAHQAVRRTLDGTR